MKFRLKDIAFVYIGKPNKCMCGCSGNYYYPSKNRKNAEGWAVDNATVREVRNLFNNFEGKIENIDNKIFTIIFFDDKENARLQYTIYTEKKMILKKMKKNKKYLQR